MEARQNMVSEEETQVYARSLLEAEDPMGNWGQGRGQKGQHEGQHDSGESRGTARGHGGDSRRTVGTGWETG